MNLGGPNVGQASSLPGERVSASGSVPSASPTGAGRMPALRCGSWKASIRFGACIGTMNPPLTPPRRGAAPFGQFATRQTPLAEWYNSYQSFDLNCTGSPKAFSGGRGVPVHGKLPFALAHALGP